MSSSKSSLQLKTDAELLDLIVEQNDQIALQTLIEKHSTLVMSVCMQILRDKNDAEDAFQNAVITFVKAPEKIKQPKFVSSWLYRVAQRESYNILRQKKRVKAESLGEHNAVTNEFEATQDKFEELTSLHEELDQLPENYRVPLILCYLEGKSRKEAASEMNVTVNSIKASLTAGRELLKKRLLKRGIALASVLAAWNASQSLVASTVSATLVQQALSSSLANSTVAGTTSLGTSVSGSKAALIKGTTWMAATTGKQITVGIVGTALLLGGTLAIIDLIKKENSKAPISSEAKIIDWELSKNSTVPLTTDGFETKELSPEIRDIIAKIKEKEPLYQNLDITMHFKEDHSFTKHFNEDASPGKYTKINQKSLEQRNLDQYVHQTLRRVTQGSMFRIEFNEKVTTITTDFLKDSQPDISNNIKQKHQAEAFDGESSSSVAVTPETPILQINPHPYQVVLASRLANAIPFSDLIHGGDYTTQLIQEKSKLPYPSSIQFQTNFIEKTQIAGEPVVVIELVVYRTVKSINKIIYKKIIHLAINRNYIPMRWEIFLNNKTILKKHYQVLTWFEREKGIWFPETSEMISTTKDKTRKINYNFEVATVAPQYPKSFFKVEKLKKTDKKSKAGIIIPRPLP